MIYETYLRVVPRMTKLADKIKEALKAGRSGQLAKRTVFERFGFPHDPFQQKVDPNNPDFYVAREEVLLDFAIQVGNTIRLFEEDPLSPFRHLLAHGLRGSGKSHLARHFDREWDQIGFQDYTTIYTDLSFWREPVADQFSSSTKTIETYESFLQNIKLVDKPLIIFIDDLDYTITGTPAIPRARQFMADIEARAENGVIIIGFVNSIALTVLLEANQKLLARDFLSYFNPEYFFFPVFSKTEIRRLITQRLTIARNPLGLFSAKAIETIANFSLGIPIVALQLASDCLEEIIIQDITKVTARIANTVVNEKGYNLAVDLVESVGEDTSEETVSLLTPKRRDIIAAILGHQLQERFFFPTTGVDGLRSSDLADFFAVNLSTMNYHIKPLTSTLPVPILEAKDDIHDARSKIFYVKWNSVMAHALELIIVHQRLTQEKYNIDPNTIFLSRREQS
ncbi:MAG: hypothetical protein ACFFC6_11465 [Promethearchaeota archaeon]